MATEVFVDTGAWYAVQVVDDRWHEAAARALSTLVSAGVTLVTTVERSHHLKALVESLPPTLREAASP